VLAEVSAPTTYQLLLPPPVGDAAFQLLLTQAPSVQAAELPQVQRRRRVHRLPQLALGIVPMRRPGRPAKIHVVLSVSEALEHYKKKWKRKHRAKLSASARKDRHRNRPSRIKAETAAVVQAPVVSPTAEWGIEAWTWTDEGRLIDGGAGVEGWAAFRLDVVGTFMTKRAAEVKAEMEAKGTLPKGPKQVRTKQQAAAAATAVLMAGKPGKKKAPAVAEGAAT
jgi:hypothetical protein